MAASAVAGSRPGFASVRTTCATPGTTGHTKRMRCPHPSPSTKPPPDCRLICTSYRRVALIPRSVTQLIDVKAQLRPGQPLFGVGQAQVGEDVAGAFLVLDAPCPSPPASYSPLTLRYLRWLLFKTRPGWRRVSVVRCQWSVARSDGRRPLATNHRRGGFQTPIVWHRLPAAIHPWITRSLENHALLWLPRCTRRVSDITLTVVRLCAR
jgi:hypothetical protein